MFLEPLVATDAKIAELESAQLRVGQGPCLSAFLTGRPVSAESIESAQHRWPEFAKHMAASGFALVQALPMRLREQRIGAMNLFRVTVQPFDETDLQTSQALTDIATIGLIHERAITQSEEVARQLQAALNSRVIIEQAKGKLAEQTKMDPDEAFQLLRRYSRSHNYRLSDLAAAFVRGADTWPGLLPS